MFEKIQRALLLPVFWLAASASGQLWTESGDAPSFPDGPAQVTRGEVLEAITGSLDVGDLRDAYCIKIFDPDSFLATTDPAISLAANATFDTRLYLFRPDGDAVLANDDTPSRLAPFLSMLTGIATDDSGYVLSQPGEYVLVVGGHPDDPQDGTALDLFDFRSDMSAVHAPKPPTGNFDHWEEDRFPTGSYTVALAGVQPCQNHLDIVFANTDAPDWTCLDDGADDFNCRKLSNKKDNTRDVALGFVNSDPNLDVVIASQDPAISNRVCLGDGTGGFSCSDVSNQTDSTTDVALGFVDGDQHLDVVFGNSGWGIHWVCLGNGEGAFDCGEINDVSSHCTGVALGFVDGDRNLDAIFACPDFSSVVCLGDGDGAFSCSDLTDVDDKTDVALGFVNDDQHLDAVFGGYGYSGSENHYQVCLGGGDGSFSCSYFGSFKGSSHGVALGYVDTDPNLDAVFGRGPRPNHICLGDGEGGFSCNELLDTEGWWIGVALGYLNSDLYLDAVFSNLERRGYNSACLGDGTGGFTCNEVGSQTRRSMGVALGDLNTTLTVFQGDFESGDTLSWSAWVPHCSGNSDCGEGEFCKKNGCDNLIGVCKPTTGFFCTGEWDPVCGCDGVTYSNACYAEQAGVNIASKGECPP